MQKKIPKQFKQQYREFVISSGEMITTTQLLKDAEWDAFNQYAVEAKLDSTCQLLEKRLAQIRGINRRLKPIEVQELRSLLEIIFELHKILHD